MTSLLAQHLPILPVLVPLIFGMACLGLNGRSLAAKRLVSLLGVVAMAVVALLALEAAASDSVQVYRLGNWPAPFGIVLVLDRLSAAMLALTAAIAVPVWWSAAAGADREAPAFHPLFQLQLLGINGAFLTGDLFNLFVFFEILLIASYGLLLWGATRERLRAGITYVAVNLTGSSLFLIALGVIYGVVGTLNLADLSAKLPLLPAADLPLAKVGGLLLAVVFSIKAALVPLHLWLRPAYTAAAVPVVTLFAIMTKIGVYALLRVFGAAFGADAGALAHVATPWLLGAALVTIVVGGAAAVAATSLRRLAAALLVASVGVMTAAVGRLEAESVGAGLFYLIGSTLVIAALFALADTVARARGEAADELRAQPWRPPPLLAVLFLVGAVAAAGLPPLPGFLGKAWILAATTGDHWTWTVILIGGLVNLVAIARAGMALFWDMGDRDTPAAPAHTPAVGSLLPAAFLVVLVLALAVLAAPVSTYTGAAATQALDPALYQRAVLGVTP